MASLCLLALEVRASASTRFSLIKELATELASSNLRNTKCLAVGKSWNSFVSHQAASAPLSIVVNCGELVKNENNFARISKSLFLQHSIASFDSEQKNNSTH